MKQCWLETELHGKLLRNVSHLCGKLVSAQTLSYNSWLNTTAQLWTATRSKTAVIALMWMATRTAATQNTCIAYATMTTTITYTI
jgi:hypothetical protein